MGCHGLQVSSTMINTYHTSLAPSPLPPPVPPRHSSSQSVLIPAKLPSLGHSKSLLRFLACVAVLQLFLTLGGCIYLYLKYEEEKPLLRSQSLPDVGKAAFLSGDRSDAEASPFEGLPMARMVVSETKLKTEQKSTAGYLQWDAKHSVLNKVNSYNNWLSIQEPGNYQVYSRVTFIGGNSSRPLVSRVRLRKDTTGEGKVVMQAFCSVDGGRGRGSAAMPRLCTASQMGVIPLKAGNQISLWVQDVSLVDYDEGATAFGMYKVAAN